MNEGLFNSTIVTWLKGQFPGASNVIKEEEVGVKSFPEPFIGYKLDSFVRLGQGEIVDPDPTTGIASVTTQNQLSLTIHYYGEDPLGGLSPCALSLEAPSVQNFLRTTAGLAVIQVFAIQSAANLLETKYQHHAVFDAYLGFADVISDTTGIISKVGVGTTVQASSETIVEEEDITSAG